MPEPTGPVRRLPHVARAIVPATDLGGVTVLKREGIFLLTDPFGDVVQDSRGLGLYAGDTRVLSCLVLLVGGARPTILRPDPGGAERGTIMLTNPDLPGDTGDGVLPEPAPPRRSLGITRQRRLDEGLHERLELDNYTNRPLAPTVVLLLDADMADIFEVRGVVRPRRGHLGPIEVRGDRVALLYRGLDDRRIRIRVRAAGARIEAAPPESGAAVRLSWQPEIAPGARVALAWLILPEVPGLEGLGAGRPRAAGGGSLDAARRSAGRPIPHPRAGLRNPTAIRSDSPEFDRVVARGVADLDLLVTPGPGPGQRYVAAGIPWFAALFGRDAILASLGALPVDPGLAVDTLRVLASLQATTDDPARDAEPGKIPHEVRVGEMARTGEVPFDRYYGSADATPLWLILLGETFDWTGDVGLIEELWPNALAALGWLEGDGDPDRDGFVEYCRRAPGGLVQHGWKDALDSIRDRDGRVADGPIALAEVQGYAYDARVRVARLARILGHAELATRLGHDARNLRARFEAAFWVADRATYALALDGRKRPMDAIGSNQGHALWSGIVGDEHAAAVARQLTGPGLDSGWGLRTFAWGQPGYSPLAYHGGTVWPHDTAIAVAGLRRAGFDALATRLGAELLEAAGYFPEGRLPEVFCGFSRDEAGPPVPYPVACSPQAWAAAAPLTILGALLGLRPQANEGRLDLERPSLPAGLTSLTLTGLRVGDATVDIRFRRRGRSTQVEVTALAGTLSVNVRA